MNYEEKKYKKEERKKAKMKRRLGDESTPSTTTTSISTHTHSFKKSKRKEEHGDLSVDAATTTATTPSTSITSTSSSSDLPVLAYKDELVASIRDPWHVTLVVAETGSGKSTQIPPFFFSAVQQENPDETKHMAVTQPRRVAAMTLAARVASEHGAKLGGPQVGYRVRFDDCTCPQTQLTYLTDGMLLREAMVDPLLSRYSIIFLDECHERSLQTDILCGVVKRALKQRNHHHHHHHHSSSSKKHHFKSISSGGTSSTGTGRVRPLKVVVMSATLDTSVFETFFEEQQTRVIRIPGRQFAVQLLYTAQPVEDYVEATLSTIMQIHQNEPPESGDILAFLPGQEEIEDTASLLKRQLALDDEERVQWTGDQVIRLGSNNSKSNNKRQREEDQQQQLYDKVMICLLYAALPPAAQLAAFAPKPPGCHRKVILATNIAETSITLPAIRYVIDCGKAKCRQVLLPTGMEMLRVETISQAQASQRAGRAGRVQDGLCFRLYTEPAFQQLLPCSVPEILRVNLSQVVLQLLEMGIDLANPDPAWEFDFVTKPDAESIKRALKLLYALEACDGRMKLTVHGKKLAKLPLDPLFGNLLLKSVEHSCINDMLTAVSVLSAENIFYRPPGDSSLLDGGGGGGASSSKAAAAHRRFTSHEGDLPTFLNVYNAWQKEAVFVPPSGSSGGGGRVYYTRKAEKKKLQQQQQLNGKGAVSLLPHGEWCLRNYISGRALVRAFHIRQQLESLFVKPVAQNGLGIEIPNDNGTAAHPVKFLKCVAAGLFLQVASRIKMQEDFSSSYSTSKGRQSWGMALKSTKGAYRTKVGNEIASVHPTSSLFGRTPAPACVVYTELVTTKKAYIRGVTQIREEWLHEVAPNFYPK